MIRLSREIRFSLSGEMNPGSRNSWAGWPSSNQIAPWLVLRSIVEGEADAETGFVCNVTLIDGIMRSVVRDHLMDCHEQPWSAEQCLLAAATQISNRWNFDAQLVNVELELSPYLKYSHDSKDPTMLTLTQQFEFSAAHRLHCDTYSEEKNRDMFGKCNNLNGHGHNYVVDVSLRRDVQDEGANGRVIALHELEATVKQRVIDRLDHKHLNLDVDYFSQVNPTVENIAIVIWQWLDGQLGKADLVAVRVYETPKTWAEYRGP
ncbi:MAG: 6-carboxytetrahydropterin synthase [Mariniblastus sp.]|nr:6-carboxytetrahydropterin synthase [Mariniblastus sp.]